MAVSTSCHIFMARKGGGAVLHACLLVRCCSNYKCMHTMGRLVRMLIKYVICLNLLGVHVRSSSTACHGTLESTGVDCSLDNMCGESL